MLPRGRHVVRIDRYTADSSSRDVFRVGAEDVWNLYDLVVYDPDEQQLSRAVLHPKLNVLVESGTLFPRARVMVREMQRVGRLTEPTEIFIITTMDVLDGMATFRRRDMERAEELVRDGHPLLSRRLFYLPVLCDSEMDSVPAWTARAVGMDDAVGYFVGTQHAKNCLGRAPPLADVLRRRRRGPAPSSEEPPQLSRDPWNDVDARPRRKEGNQGSSESNVLQGGHAPVLVGRLVSVGRLTYFGRSDHTHLCPYKCSVRIADASCVVDVVIWATLAASLHPFLRRLLPGTFVVVENFTVKTYRGRLEVALNPSHKSHPGGTVRALCLTRPDNSFWSGAHVGPKLRENAIPLDDDHGGGDREGVALRWLQEVYPFPELRLVAFPDLARDFVAGDGCSLAGIITLVSPIVRLVNGPPDREGLRGLPRQPWGPMYAYRWVRLRDPISRAEVDIQVFGNGYGRNFAALQPGQPLLATFLQVRGRRKRVSAAAGLGNLKPVYLSTTEHSQLVSDPSRLQSLDQREPRVEELVRVLGGLERSEVNVSPLGNRCLTPIVSGKDPVVQHFRQPALRLLHRPRSLAAYQRLWAPPGDETSLEDDASSLEGTGVALPVVSIYEGCMMLRESWRAQLRRVLCVGQWRALYVGASRVWSLDSTPEVGVAASSRSRSKRRRPSSSSRDAPPSRKRRETTSEDESDDGNGPGDTTGGVWLEVESLEVIETVSEQSDRRPVTEVDRLFVLLPTRVDATLPPLQPRVEGVEGVEDAVLASCLEAVLPTDAPLTSAAEFRGWVGNRTLAIGIALQRLPHPQVSARAPPGAVVRFRDETDAIARCEAAFVLDEPRA